MKKCYTLPDDVSTLLEECSTDCKNLRTFFQFPPQRSSSLVRAVGGKELNKECALQRWNAAISTMDWNLSGKSPWSPQNIRQVASKHARSAAPRWPELSISRIRWAGSSSIQTARLHPVIGGTVFLDPLNQKQNANLCSVRKRDELYCRKSPNIDKEWNSSYQEKLPLCGYWLLQEERSIWNWFRSERNAFCDYDSRVFERKGARY